MQSVIQGDARGTGKECAAIACAVCSPVDEQLHRHLGDVTNRARLMLEDAMEYAIRVETLHPPEIGRAHV